MVKTNVTTVKISGVTAVEFDRSYPYFAVRNDGSSAVHVSATVPECVAGTDGVVTVAAGGSYVANGGGNVLYLNGGGTATVQGQFDKFNPFKVAAKGGDKSNILCGGNVYTGTEYDELTKPISGLKNELINYFGFGSDGDFIPCNADGTIGFTISAGNIQQNYGASKIMVDESRLLSLYSIILKNEKIFAFKNGEKEIHVAAKDKNGNVVLIWCYNSMFSITNALGTTGITIPHTAHVSTSFVHYAAPMCDFMTGNEIDGLHLVIASKSNEYTNYFVDFGGDIYRLFGQGGDQGRHQFAVKVKSKPKEE